MKYEDKSEEFLLDFFNQPQSKLSGKINSVLSSNPTWPILYHLSPQRELLLDWFPFKRESTLLEVGAGCGALTGLFCRKVKRVFANELDNKRSQILTRRYLDKKNLTIITGNVLDMKFNIKFDYITVIGVLEYSGRYINRGGNNNISLPYNKFLNRIYELLRPGGKAIIAIENKIGLKYLAGGREDHYGDLFSSIENYPAYSGIKTFSQGEIKQLLFKVGFSDIQYYFPFPDYKLPSSIFSKDGISKLNVSLSSYIPIVDYSTKRYPVFNEVLYSYSLLNEGLLEQFANSFLIIATK